jgi:hypothetical protein
MTIHLAERVFSDAAGDLADATSLLGTPRPRAPRRHRRPYLTGSSASPHGSGQILAAVVNAAANLARRACTQGCSLGR